MTRQQQIPGTERKTIDDVEDAANKYREVRDERMEMTKKETQAKLALIATMQAHKVQKYKFADAEGEELLVALEDKVNVKVRKTGEANGEVGDGVEASGDPDEPVPQSLVDQANGTGNADDGDPFAATRAGLDHAKDKPKRDRPKKHKA